VLQHVSDHRGSIIREPYTVLDIDVAGVMAAYGAIALTTSMSTDTIEAYL